MNTRPDLRDLPVRYPTEVLCPHGCGAAVLTLRPGDAVRTASRAIATRTLRGTCPTCGEPWAIPIVEETDAR